MIRKMTILDYEAVLALWMKTGNIGLRSLDDSREGVAAFLKRNLHTNFVAVDGGRIIGAILSGHDGRRGYIYHTAVQEEHRRQGLGRRLAEAAVAALEREGITRVCLNVMVKNEQGRRFWEQLGWKKKDLLELYSK